MEKEISDRLEDIGDDLDFDILLECILHCQTDKNLAVQKLSDALAKIK